jgi:hypothetical protein
VGFGFWYLWARSIKFIVGICFVVPRIPALAGIRCLHAEVVDLELVLNLVDRVKKKIASPGTVVGKVWCGWLRDMKRELTEQHIRLVLFKYIQQRLEVISTLFDSVLTVLHEIGGCMTIRIL